MTGRERVKAALTFSGPDRVPRDLWSVSYIPLFRQDELDAVRARFPMDIERPEPAPGVWSHAADHLRKAGSYTDEWGVGWQVGEPGIVGEVKNPPLADWSKLSSFRPPVHLHHDIDWDYVNRQCDASDRFMLSDECALTFERLQFLRGTEALLMDIAYGAKELTRLIEMVHSFYLESVTRWSKSDVDGVFLSDDWGSNTALLIDPSTWRSLFKPLYRQYCSIIRANGKFAFFHSDGNISAIYDDLVEV
jgi:uroporphyrinogen decarboxylase